MADSVPPSERRIGARYLACYPASIVRPDGQERQSLIRDISVSGVLLLVNTAKLIVGDVIQLRLFITSDVSAFHSTSGRVVRVEELPEGSLPWTRRVAVQFDEVLEKYADDIDAFKERSRAIEWIR
jgi:c-di-GMP-binding flagellar brake protein YcgR